MNKIMIMEMLMMLILAVLIAISTKWREKPDKTPNILSRENTLGLRGFACVAVIIHHTSMQYAYNEFAFAGIIFVAMFFFLSGYGTYAAYAANPEKYTAGYFRTRILYMLGTYMFIDIAFWVVSHTLTKNAPLMWGIWDAVKSGDMTTAFRLIDVYRPHEWFANAILFVYVITYIGMRLARGNKNVVIAASILATVVWISIWIPQETGRDMSFRYNTVHMFPIGMLFAMHQEKIFDFYNRHSKAITISTLMIAIVTKAITSILSQQAYIIAITIMLSKQVYVVATTALILIILTRITFVRNPCRYIGVISLEAYLVQSVFTRGYPEIGSPIGKLPMNGIWCIFCTLAAGAIWHAILKPFRTKICGRKS